MSYLLTGRNGVTEEGYEGDVACISGGSCQGQCQGWVCRGNLPASRVIVMPLLCASGEIVCKLET